MTGNQRLDDNAFGKLVRSSREQRNWSQGELATRWGYSREYVSQVERGKRKLEKWEQVQRLADILDIAPEQLNAIGKSVPLQRPSLAEQPAEADDLLLQALLEPSLATVKLSWLLWLADGKNPALSQSLTDLVVRLEDALTRHHGQFLRPAQQVLAYAHEMLGKVAFDGLHYTEAMGHFQEMLDLGEELSDPDLIALAHIHRADILRKRGRYETAVRLLNTIEPVATRASEHVQGMRWQILARAHAAYGQEPHFTRAIDQAEEIATTTKDTIDTQYSQFNLVEVLQERAQGYTMLWMPERALEIYPRTDQLKPFRPMREQGSYLIIKAQAHAYRGDLDQGIALATQGMSLAQNYGSKRHVSRVQGMYDRLSVTRLGKQARMKDLRHALISAQARV